MHCRGCWPGPGLLQTVLLRSEPEVVGKVTQSECGGKEGL